MPIRLRDTSGNAAPYAPTFLDAITRYGSILVEDDLGEAYRRAGNTFNKQMRQTFAVLKEQSTARVAQLYNWMKYFF